MTENGPAPLLGNGGLHLLCEQDAPEGLEEADEVEPGVTSPVYELPGWPPVGQPGRAAPRAGEPDESDR